MSFLTTSRTLPHPVLSEHPSAAPATAEAPVPGLSASQQLDGHLASAIAELSSTKAAPMTTTPEPKPGSFAAELRAMLQEGLAGVEKAKEDGRAQVREAVGELSKAASASAKVSGSMAQTIKDQAATIMSDLGQISNDLG